MIPPVWTFFFLTYIYIFFFFPDWAKSLRLRDFLKSQYLKWYCVKNWNTSGVKRGGGEGFGQSHTTWTLNPVKGTDFVYKVYKLTHLHSCVGTLCFFSLQAFRNVLPTKLQPSVTPFAPPPHPLSHPQMRHTHPEHANDVENCIWCNFSVSATQVLHCSGGPVYINGYSAALQLKCGSRGSQRGPRPYKNVWSWPCTTCQPEVVAELVKSFFSLHLLLDVCHIPSLLNYSMFFNTSPMMGSLTQMGYFCKSIQITSHSHFGKNKSHTKHF